MTRRFGCVSIGLLGAALALGFGCGDEKASADAAIVYDAQPQTGTLSLTWSLTDGTNALTCADVGSSVSVRISATPTIGGFGQVDAFNCESGSGTSRPIAVGNYRVTIELRVSNGELATPVIVNNVDVTVGADTALDPVSFTVNPRGNFTFNVATEATGDNCAAPPTGGGVSEISIEFRDSAGGCSPATFEVAAGAGQPAGTYTTTCPAGAPFSIASGCGVEKDQTITVTGVRSGTHTMVISANKGALQCWKRSPQFIVPANDLTLSMGTQVLMLDSLVPGCDPNVVDAGAMPDAGIVDATTTDAP